MTLFILACITKPPVDTADTNGDTSTDTSDTSPSDTDTSPPDDSDPPVVDADGDGSPETEDCDDDNDTRFPGASEVCNGVDDDCDTQVDEDVLLEFFADTDGDGYGAGPVWACSAPEAMIVTGGDCDDTASDVFPGATEVCDDDIDQNCDGQTDGACRRWSGEYGDSDADLSWYDFPSGWAATGDLSGDGSVDVITGSTTYFELSGTTYVFDDPMAITDSTDAVSTIASGGAEPYLASMGWAGDFTGDGADDLMLSGSVGYYLFEGPLFGALTSTDATASFPHTDVGTARGWMATLDADVDGNTDLVLSEVDPNYAVYIVQGPAIPGVYAASSTIATIRDPAESTTFATVFNGLGDVTGDGVEDLGVGDGAVVISGMAGGAVYIYEGPVLGDYTPADADHRFASAVQSVNTPFPAGDLNDDGHTDVAISGSHGAFVLSGPVSLTALTDADATATIEDSGWVTATVDVDGDGRADWLGGNPSGSRYSPAYLYYGPLLGTLGVADADATFGGYGYYNAFGAQILAEDLNGDAAPDLLFTNPEPYTARSLHLFLGG